MTLALVSLAAFVVAAIGTKWIIEYAIRRRVIDVPSARSSHAVPTPRGGGAAVTAALVAAYVAGCAAIAAAASALLPIAGLLVAAGIGWVDDHRGASVRVRLQLHAIAALTLLPLVLWPTPIPWTWPAAIAAAAWLFGTVSAINVVNFMDGIDGLVASQAVVFGIHLALLSGLDSAGIFGVALAGASAGFLCWNWAPAKIFLGDVGSGALGFAMVFGGALAARARGLSLLVVFLPLYPMFLDATTTLIRRALRGERLIEAHRSHLYQTLANGRWGHARVTMLYAAAAIAGVAVAGLRDPSAWAVVTGLYFALVLAAGVRLTMRRA